MWRPAVGFRPTGGGAKHSPRTSLLAIISLLIFMKLNSYFIVHKESRKIIEIRRIRIRVEIKLIMHTAVNFIYYFI